MRIDSFSDKPDRAGRYLIRFDNGKTMRLYRQTVEDYGLYPGKELTEDEAEQLRADAGQMSAKMRAVRIVSAASVSEADLRQRLIRKGEDPRQAQEAVQWMTDLNLVDDRQTAQQIVSRCASRGYGVAKAKQMLYEKRIPKEYWQEALEDYPDQIDRIVEFLRSRLDGAPDDKAKKKAIDALLRRGHSYADVRSALSRLELEEFPEDHYG